MGNAKSREVTLAVKITDELNAALDKLRQSWKEAPSSIPRGLACSESKKDSSSWLHPKRPSSRCLAPVSSKALARWSFSAKNRLLKREPSQSR